MQVVTEQGFAIYGAQNPQIPVLVSVPHAGREYPEELFALLRLPRASLVRLEDRYADLLARDVIGQSYPSIIAHRARAWIDLNRGEHDLDLEMVSGAVEAKYPIPGPKQRGGLGLIPRRLAGEGELWKERLPMVEVEQRLMDLHRPYHEKISQILYRMRDQFGVAILLDLHSMPPIKHVNPMQSPRFVIGDYFGKSASSRYSELLVEQIRHRGFTVALNHPYSGDHILRRHGEPRQNIHAIQVEVDRSLYLESSLREPSTGVDMVSRLVADMVNLLAKESRSFETLIAAE